MSRLFKSFVLLLLALFALDCSGHAFGYWKFDGPSTFGLVVWSAITVGAMWASLSQLRSLGTSPVSSHEAGASRPVIGQAEGTPAHEAAAQRPGRSRSYIARHWRGELSLARSYWVN